MCFTALDVCRTHRATRGDVQVQEAAHSLPEAAQGVHIIQSSEQFEALVKVNADRTVVLLAGLSWCRPCKGLTRPMEKLAKHYADGAVFAKVMGDHSDNTKRFFKNVLEVRPGVQACPATLSKDVRLDVARDSRHRAAAA